MEETRPPHALTEQIANPWFRLVPTPGHGQRLGAEVCRRTKKWLEIVRFKEQVPHVFVCGDHRPTYLSVFPPSARIRALALPWKKRHRNRSSPAGGRKRRLVHLSPSIQVLRAFSPKTRPRSPVAGRRPEHGTGPARPGKPFPSTCPAIPGDPGSRKSLGRAGSTNGDPQADSVYALLMTRNLEVDWIDPMTAHVANRTGRAVFDVDLRTTGKVTVDGKSDWSFTAEKLPDGEFIGLYQVKDDVGWATAPPFLEITWRSEDSTEESHTRVPLHHNQE
ncbi:hypothetical protein [Paeniglutamicibacter sp.]|uniref:hypothetical protein n=1 Tax=Paeniglutamicibacter sp. TaxID=1934391 RepID=UPI003989D307